MPKFFQKYQLLLSILAILFLATVLRFYKLGAVPHGMTWDEAAIGYNGYAIFKTRRDEWLFKLPTSFRSFGDYKAPLAIYLNGLFTFFGGMNLWAVRLPFAIAGVLAVVGMMLLTNQLFKNKQLALLAGLLMTLSPWHLHFSRIGFESGLALAFLIWAIYLFLKFNKFSFLVAGILAVAAIYSYHSAKIVLPLLFLVLLILNKKFVIKKLPGLLGSGILALLLLLPFLKDALWGKGLERAGTLIFSQSDSLISGSTLFIKQFILHLTPQFLLLGQTTTLRHGAGTWGVFLPSTLVLIIASLFFVKKNIKNNNFKLAICWVIIGILPAALGTDGVPHQNRALLALPGFLLLAVIGFSNLVEAIGQSRLNKKIIGSHGEKNVLVKSFAVSFLLIHGIFFLKYLNYYYSDFAKNSAAAFQDGYIAAFNFIKPYEESKDKIIFTSEYGQPYIYALFAKKTNPIWYQGGALVKYEFTDKIGFGDRDRKNSIIVTGQKVGLDLPIHEADKIIYGSDGEVRFKIYLTE